jgi:hypothetical protein
MPCARWAPELPRRWTMASPIPFRPPGHERALAAEFGLGAAAHRIPPLNCLPGRIRSQLAEVLAAEQPDERLGGTLEAVRDVLAILQAARSHPLTAV